METPLSGGNGGCDPWLTVIMVGTNKGLFRFASPDRVHWEALGPVLRGTSVHTTAYHAPTRTVFAGANSVFYGAAVRRSRDGGETWDRGGEGLAYEAGDPERVTAVWSLAVADEHGPGTIYAGVEASGLFRSMDGGDAWAEVAALRRHPTHEVWDAGFGGKCLHTIAVDPHDANSMYIAASTGGIYRSGDRGATWNPVNQGIRAEFMPEGQQYPAAGQCVHKFGLSAARAGRIWLQNHGGVYRSDDAGVHWERISAPLPDDFGFPVVPHPRRAETAFVVPLTSTLERWYPEERMAVHRTDDGGQTWSRLNAGLPDRVYSGVLRDAFRADTQDPLGLYVGTTNGQLFGSADEGASWTPIAERLPRILSVQVVEGDPFS